MAIGVRDEYHEMIVKAERFVAKTDAPTDIVTAGAATYTAAQILGGIIVRDPTGGARTDVLPTAALLVGAMLNPRVGDTLACLIVNAADQDEAITLDAGTGGAWHTSIPAAAKVIAQNTSKTVRIRITGISTPAYVIYS